MRSLLSFLAIFVLILINLCALMRVGSSLINLNNNNNFDEEEELPLFGEPLVSRSATDDKQQASSSKTTDNRQQSAASQLPPDPFEFTFRDYIREQASKWSTAADGSHDKAASSIVIEDEEENNNSSNSNDIPTSRKTDEEETNRLNNKYHYDQNDAASASNDIRSSSSINSADTINTIPATEQQASSSLSSSNEADAAPDEEAGLLFAWKTLPTTKCSRSCGKGYRLNHLSCLDLKFGVRVEDELCLKAPKLAKPSELSDEPCNEIDCEPKWQLVEELCPGNEDNKSCRTKRIECTKVDSRGQLVYLDERNCNSARDKSQEVSAMATPSTATKELNKIPQNNEEDESLDVYPYLVSSSSDENNVHQLHLSANDDHQHQHHHRHQNNRFSAPNEPFLEAGEWSECRDGPCGNLGRRYRNVTCKLFLTKSEKFVELPLSSCQLLSGVNLARDEQPGEPHREEPCYMDCLGGADNNNNNNDIVVTANSGHSPKMSEIYNNEDQGEDLIVSHRYIWKHLSWTECSARCLGGKRESQAECYDQVAGRPAKSEHLCDAQTRPTRPLMETCNQIPCAPEWRLEPFSNCSRKCGSAGIRSRSVACVELVPLETGESDYMLVSNDLCLQHNEQLSMPHKLEPCNRFDCPPEWQVSDWSECRPRAVSGHSQQCHDISSTTTEGHRNRTVICVQEFASRDAATGAGQTPGDRWHPGKAVQVAPERCQEAHRYVPAISEKCFVYGDQMDAKDCNSVQPFIDSDRLQNYRPSSDSLARKRTVTLKVGGKAQLVEGRNLKLRCRLLSSSGGSKGFKMPIQAVEWRKDGQLIFAPNSTWAEYLPVAQPPDSATEDNSILASDVLLNSHELLADEPAKQSDAARFAPPTESTVSAAKSKKAQSGSKTKTGRNLTTRSNANNNHDHQLQQQQPAQSHHFVAQLGGRFSLVKENTLKIKRLKQHDSGTYTCSSPLYSVSESLDLSVVGKRQLLTVPSNSYYSA